MILKNANLNGKIKAIQIENGRILKIADEISGNAVDLNGKTVIPGLIDVHTHGCYNLDTMDADLVTLSKNYARLGTTSFLPTTMTQDFELVKKVLNAKTDLNTANILGIHLEGPFIAKEQKGAQDPKFILKPNYDLIKDFPNVKMITVAPELDGAIEFINKASKTMVVSLGHTVCDYHTAKEAIKAGAKCLTHMYNAMPPMLHRAPGPIGAAADTNIYAQIICDPVHVSPSAFMCAYKIFGPNRLVLISDSIRCAGMGDGEYICGGLRVSLKNKKATLKDGTIAGSCLSLLDCVKNAVSYGVKFSDAVKMATATPAKLLKVKKGEIKVGYDADLLILDNKLNIDSVIINGNFT